MEYRSMDKIGEKVSLLGFGCMRFPKDEQGEIDEVLTEKMLDEALKCGVNYIDTAYLYHNRTSEDALGKLLKKYDRSSYKLATKLPDWILDSKEEAQKILEEQLSKLQTDYIDFYLLHALDARRWEHIKKLDLISLCRQWQRAGKIRHLGFSFHDGYEVFEEIIKAENWDFCQIQLNYMDADFQAGERGYRLTEELGIPLIVMEPIRGGMLVNLPKDLAERFHQVDKEASLASWALRWAASHSNVKVILSGMSSYENVLDNLNTFKEYKPLGEEEAAAVRDVQKELLNRVKSRCTGCGYCMPCPFGVNIPENFQFYNACSLFDDARSRRLYYGMGKTQSTACRECGKCEKACPQHIKIREELKNVTDFFQPEEGC